MTLSPWRNHSTSQPQDVLALGVGSRQFFTALEKSLPPVFTRKTASEAIGGLISPKTMSNDDALGRGPSEKVRIGNKVGYEKASFLLWLKNKIRSW